MHSTIKHVSHVDFPRFNKRSCYMVGMSLRDLPTKGMGPYESVIRTMMDSVDIRGTDRFFVTIDEKVLQPGMAHRRGGVHIDGNWIEPPASRFNKDWVNHPKQQVSSLPYWEMPDRDTDNNIGTGGMLIAASEAASVAWKGLVHGIPGEGGDCEHLRDQLNGLTVVPLLHNRVYLTNSTCLHESIPVQRPIKRQLIRITLPHDMKVL